MEEETKEVKSLLKQHQSQARRQEAVVKQEQLVPIDITEVVAVDS